MNEAHKPLYEIVMYDPNTGTKALLVIDTVNNGLTAGGIRMTPTVSLEEIRRLARAMTHKFSLVGVPLGGAKAGIVADPASPDKEAHLRAFARLAEPFLKELYIAGEDMGTTAEDLALIYRESGASWMELAKRKLAERGIALEIPQHFDPTDVGGHNLEEILAGYGAAEVTEEACTHLGLAPQKARVSIQGFGTVGSWTARYLAEKGFSIVAVADAQGTLYSPDGLAVEELLRAKDELGTIVRDKLTNCDYEELDRDGWPAVEAEVLIPAAVADAIHGENVSHVNSQVRLVVEAANLPVTERAERALFERGVALVPDLIASAGAAGGLGMALMGQVPLDPTAIMQELSLRMRRAVREALSMSEQYEILPREAAMRLAQTSLD